ncbi:MAG: cupin domain-containing protein [Chloroflexi bacterium]|nr:cupin domain-containing protein [Chloroflexota bacterium]
MNQIFKATNWWDIPDGTLLSPFLNSKDSNSDLPFDLLNGFSIAAGKLKPGIRSHIHILPSVTQVNFVLNGELTIRMGEKGKDKRYYEQVIRPNEAVLTNSGTFLELCNFGKDICEVLYIISPAYVYVLEDGEVIYDDSIMIPRDTTWGNILSDDWTLTFPYDIDREEASERIRALKSSTT